MARAWIHQDYNLIRTRRTQQHRARSVFVALLYRFQPFEAVYMWSSLSAYLSLIRWNLVPLGGDINHLVRKMYITLAQIPLSGKLLGPMYELFFRDLVWIGCRNIKTCEYSPILGGIIIFLGSLVASSSYCSPALSPPPPPPPIVLSHPFYLLHPSKDHFSLYSHIYHTFSPMPQKVSRLWGTRFDSLNSSDTPPPPSAHPDTTETLDSPNPRPAQQTRNDNSDTRDQKMPHDASIFVGRWYFLSPVGNFKLLIFLIAFLLTLNSPSSRAFFLTIWMNIKKSRISNLYAIPKVVYAPSFNVWSATFLPNLKQTLNRSSVSMFWSHRVHCMPQSSSKLWIWPRNLSWVGICDTKLLALFEPS